MPGKDIITGYNDKRTSRHSVSGCQSQDALEEHDRSNLSVWQGAQSAYEFLKLRLQRCAALCETRWLWIVLYVFLGVLCLFTFVLKKHLCKYCCFLFGLYTSQQLPMPMFYTVHAPRTTQQTFSTYTAANFQFKGWVCIYSKSILIQLRHM